MSGNNRARVIDLSVQSRAESVKGPYSDIPLDLSPILRDVTSYGRTCFGRGSIKAIDYATYVLSQIANHINDPERLKEIVAKHGNELKRMKYESRAMMHKFEDDQ